MKQMADEIKLGQEGNGTEENPNTPAPNSTELVTAILDALKKESGTILQIVFSNEYGLYYNNQMVPLNFSITINDQEIPATLDFDGNISVNIDGVDHILSIDGEGNIKINGTTLGVVNFTNNRVDSELSNFEYTVSVNEGVTIQTQQPVVEPNSPELTLQEEAVSITNNQRVTRSTAASALDSHINPQVDIMVDNINQLIESGIITSREQIRAVNGLIGDLRRNDEVFTALTVEEMGLALRLFDEGYRDNDLKSIFTSLGRTAMNPLSDHAVGVLNNALLAVDDGLLTVEQVTENLEFLNGLTADISTPQHVANALLLKGVEGISISDINIVLNSKLGGQDNIEDVIDYIGANGTENLEAILALAGQEIERGSSYYTLSLDEAVQIASSVPADEIEDVVALIATGLSVQAAIDVNVAIEDAAINLDTAGHLDRTGDGVRFATDAIQLSDGNIAGPDAIEQILDRGDINALPEASKAALNDLRTLLNSQNVSAAQQAEVVEQYLGELNNRGNDVGVALNPNR